MDIAALVAFHRAQGRIATVTAVHPTSRYGEMKVEAGRVTEFNEKPTVADGLVSGGILRLRLARLRLPGRRSPGVPRARAAAEAGARRPAFGLRARRVLAPDGHLP
ncbi:MAG: sugar phosphate nucleotidyltransferase [Thermoanaerobaculia bacterium]